MKQTINIRLEEEVLRQLRKQAAEEGRSLSNLIQRLIDKGMAK